MWKDKAEEMVRRYHELTAVMADPSVAGDFQKYQEYARSVAEIEPVVQVYQRYCEIDEKEKEDRLFLKEERDPELRQMLEEEIAQLGNKLDSTESEVKELLLPKDTRDMTDTLVEIRAGTGGEEAALFVAALLRMYSRFAEKSCWKVEIMNSNPTELGGYKEIIFAVEGKGAFSKFKYESGVHRVQRVPVTEAGGRIHTSTATVAVLAEADDIEVTIRPEDVRVDVYRSSGPGGQSVNTTDSAVRLTHLPTGLVVTCQDEKSQHKNKAKAMRILKARLQESERNKQKEEIDEERRGQIGSGERSERIRTYNYPQNRVTDHRTHLTLYRLDAVLEGDLDEIVDSLAAEEKSRLLEKVL